MRETIVYTVCLLVADAAGRLEGCQVEEEVVRTTAPPEDRENRTAGFWRTETPQSDDALREWVNEWWPKDVPVGPRFVVVRRA